MLLNRNSEIPNPQSQIVKSQIKPIFVQIYKPNAAPR